MPTRFLRFRVNTTPTLADGANGVLLATASGAGLYPQTLDGMPDVGWVANPLSVVDAPGIVGDSKFGLGQLVVATGSGGRRLKINEPAGTYLVRLQTGLTNSGSGYCSPRARILDSDGSTPLYAQPGSGDVITDGDSVPAQINTNGSKQAVGAADAGVEVTTTGTGWFVEWTGSGSFQDRASYVEWTLVSATPAFARFSVENPNTTWTAGVPLSPITVTARDQNDNVWTGALPPGSNPATVTDLTLAFDVTGTLSRSFVAGVATFNDLVPVASTGALGAPTVTAGTPVESPTTLTVPITTSGPGTWPGGVVVQVQTQRGTGAWTTATPSTGSASLVFTRESASYAINVRGIATHGGSPPDSTPSTPFSLTVPALAVSAIADATPLNCKVQLYPGSPEAVSATAGGAMASVVGRSDSDNVLRITDVTRAIEGDAAVPTSIAFQLEGPEGIVFSDTMPAPSAGVYRTGISRTAFIPSRGTLLLRIILTASDSSVTQLTLLVPQGVRG